MAPARPTQRAPEWQVWAALLIVYFVWGSTYLAISVVVDTMPPLSDGRRPPPERDGAILFAILLARARRRLDPAVARRVAGRGVRRPGSAAGRQRPGRARRARRAERPDGADHRHRATLRRAAAPRCSASASRLGTYIGIAVGFVGVAVLIIPEGLGKCRRCSAWSCHRRFDQLGGRARSSPSESRCRAIRWHRPAARWLSVAGPARGWLLRASRDVHFEQFQHRESLVALALPDRVRQRAGLHGLHVAAPERELSRASRPTRTSTRSSRSSLARCC